MSIYWNAILFICRSSLAESDSDTFVSADSDTYEVESQVAAFKLEFQSPPLLLPEHIVGLSICIIV